MSPPRVRLLPVTVAFPPPLHRTRCYSIPEGWPCFQGEDETLLDSETCNGLVRAPSTEHTPSGLPSGGVSAASALHAADCSGCRFVDPTQGGINEWRGALRPFTPTAFGERCFTLGAATAIFFSRAGGGWPGLPDFSLRMLPGAMRANPQGCYRLPDGYPCYADEAGTSDATCPKGQGALFHADESALGTLQTVAPIGIIALLALLTAAALAAARKGEAPTARNLLRVAGFRIPASEQSADGEGGRLEEVDDVELVSWQAEAAAAAAAGDFEAAWAAEKAAAVARKKRQMAIDEANGPGSARGVAGGRGGAADEESDLSDSADGSDCSSRKPASVQLPEIDHDTSVRSASHALPSERQPARQPARREDLTAQCTASHVYSLSPFVSSETDETDDYLLAPSALAVPGVGSPAMAPAAAPEVAGTGGMGSQYAQSQSVVAQARSAVGKQALEDLEALDDGEQC